MLRRNTQESVYIITGCKHTYTVILERLHNSNCGCPRYKARLIVWEETKEGKAKVQDGLSLYSAVYTFSGHYLNELGEARWIVEQYERGE